LGTEMQRMNIIDLEEAQVEYMEARLSAFDAGHMPAQMEGQIRIGIIEEGRLIAGLDACVTAFRILYVSTVFVEEGFRRKGYGRRLMEEMEKRALAMGVNTIRLDTFSWQGREFYQALQYEVVGQYENAEDGYTEYFFIKRLG